ncbi:MAG: bifunctional oligoribonuclease/PAP phosphatase NrnA [Anaerolineales bacterium]|nr:bifunctional oligoribonuclease/PAP phosphatase NrnA [Anaerolineales bacterium]
MSLDEALLQVIRQELQAAQRLLLVSHIRPDGDAVGALLGFGLALEAAGKDVSMVLADGVPAIFRRLEGSQRVQNRPHGRFDWICVIDCSDLERVGGVLDEVGPPDLNIDHHQTNLNFARHNLVDMQAVAAAEIIAEMLLHLELPLTQPVAAALLTGLITDTIGFRTSNMTPRALRLAASLMEAGADLPELYRRALVSRSYEAARLWGAGLSRLERGGRMVWTSLTLADRAAAGYPGRDDADLVNVLSAIEDSDVALIFVEQPNGRVKVSWRAQPGFDISQIALGFGGGGHPAASGADIQGSLQQVQADVLQATRVYLSGEDFFPRINPYSQIEGKQ